MRIPFPRSRALACAALLGLLCACLDGETLTRFTDRGRWASLAMVPVLPSGPALADAAPINQIRIRVLAVPGSVQSEEVTTVDPSAVQWELGVDIALAADPLVRYVIEVELINGADGIRTVEWSGRTGALRLSAGMLDAVRRVEVLRGPLDNLSVTALVLTGPAAALELETFKLQASVQKSSATAQPVVYWTSLTPELATMGPDATGTAQAAGVARIQAEAGPITAVHLITIAGIPTDVVVSPANADLMAGGQETLFGAVVRDRRQVPIAGEAVTWTAGDGRILVSLGGGRFRSLGPGTTTVEARSVRDPSLSGTATVRVF